MIDLQLVCCPACRHSLRHVPSAEDLRCTGCARTYPVRSGVPVLLRDPPMAETAHQVDLAERPGYAPWKERLVLKALTDAQVALDFGAGRQVLDDPCIVKIDVIWDRTLDVVGDLHELPMASESVDFAFGGAVMEHIRDPGRAIEELWRVLRPGGYVYADWSFLSAYHGYPNHYFNVTVHGIQQAFGRFTCLEAGVAPHANPSWALRSVLGTYLEHFTPVTRVDHELFGLLHRVLWHPLDELDAQIPDADRFRTAAAVYFFGVKQPNGFDTILPEPVMEAHRRRPDLQARYPQPLNVAAPDNLMTWARQHGVREEPAIQRYFESVVRFAKDGREYGARVVRDWPDQLMTRAEEEPAAAKAKHVEHWFSRPYGHRVLDLWEARGVYGVATCVGLSLRRFATHTLGRVIWFRRAVRASKDVWARATRGRQRVDPDRPS